MARILLVEDNENNIYLTRFILERNGHEIVAARSGEEGIQLAQQLGPVLIIMDIQLPDQNGFEVTRHLRNIPGFETMPIVALTSFAMTGDRERAHAAGCSGYIEKPIDPETFVNTIEAFLPRAAARP